MNHTCFICNTHLIPTSKNAINIFGESPSKKSAIKASCILSQVLGRPVSEEIVHSNIICKKCHKLCTDYNALNEKLEKKRCVLQEMINDTIAKHKLLDLKQISIEHPLQKYSDKPMAKLVLPSSKLKPLPADYVLNVGNINVHNNKVVKMKSIHMNPTCSSLATETSTTASITPKGAIESSNQNDSRIHNTINQNPNQSSDVKVSSALLNIPNTNKSQVIKFDTIRPNILSKNRTSYKTPAKINDESSYSDTTDPLQIDQDCNYDDVPCEDSNLMIDENYKDPAKETYSSIVRELLEGTKLEELTDEEEQTIVMEDRNGEIHEMMSGRKYVYSGGELTLMAQSDREDTQDDYGNGYNGESHIELQLSGDDETTQAIIAAASEQGGAFLKLESGEMFRVETAPSKSNNEAENHKNNYSYPIVDMVKEENGQFTCLLCKNLDDPLGTTSATVGDAEFMMAHLKIKHNARLYICTVCNSILRRKTDHAKHCQTHQIKTIVKKKTFECSICKKTYISNKLLREHMNMHTGKRPYSCSLCSKGFASKYTYQAHLKTHTDRPRPFKCNKCLKTFLNQTNLTQHEKSHLGLREFKCTVCDKGYSSKHSLSVHRVVHASTKPYSCDHCGKSFARRNEVQDHIRTHTGERPFACDICGASFTQRSNLHSHRKATHYHVRPHACSVCSKRFKRRRLLEYHMKSTHTGERPLTCEICRTTFVYPEHYRKHKRIHSGEKPYDCEVCGKTFNSRDNRNTHRFVHSDKKPYECVVCGIGYMRKQLLYVHMNISGHVAESIVVNQPRVQQVRSSDMASSSPSNTERSEDDQPILVDVDMTKLNRAKGGEIKTDDGVGRADDYFTNSGVEYKYELQDDSYHREDDNMDENHPKVESSQEKMPTTPEQLTADQVQLITTPSNASNVRLVQVQIKGGGMVWVAIAEDGTIAGDAASVANRAKAGDAASVANRAKAGDAANTSSS